MALPLDEVVEAEVCIVRLNERTQERLAAGWQHKVCERLVVPLDLFDELDVELNCGQVSIVFAWVRRVGDVRQVLSAKLKP